MAMVRPATNPASFRSCSNAATRCSEPACDVLRRFPRLIKYAVSQITFQAQWLPKPQSHTWLAQEISLAFGDLLPNAICHHRPEPAVRFMSKWFPTSVAASEGEGQANAIGEPSMDIAPVLSVWTAVDWQLSPLSHPDLHVVCPHSLDPLFSP
jgi:hypothetical protein